jgi:uncharacterized protein (DUF362 family)
MRPIADGLDWIGVFKKLTPGTRIAIKPNLTFPTFRKGVMTNPGAIESLVRLLKDTGAKITICESDSGGYNRFSMDEVFRETGLNEVASKYGVRILNMSHTLPRPVTFTSRSRQFSIPVSAVLLEETDLFITMPVPKIHMNTLVSASVKNQWGVIQQPSERLKLHPFFAEVVYEINKSLPPSVSVIDGRYGLNRSGPMKGDVVDLNWLMVADNIFAADFACCTLMQIDPVSVPYLRYAFQREGISSLDQFQFNCDYSQFVSKQAFFLRRNWTDYPGLLAFRSRIAAYLGYRSPLAGFLHWLLYRFREPFYDYRPK